MGNLLAKYYIWLLTEIVISLIVLLGIVYMTTVYISVCKLWIASCDYTAADGSQSLLYCSRCGKAA